MSTQKSFQTYTPRARPLNYDALQQDIGCRDIVGTKRFQVLPFSRICIFNHDANSEVFNRDDRVSYALGPESTGNPPPWLTSWAAWVDGKSVRVAKASSITLPNSTTGNVSSLFPNLDTAPSKVSIGFTSEGQIGLAVQVGTSIRVKWFKDADGTYGDTSFLGESPVLFGSASLVRTQKATDGDLVLYYLRDAQPRAIFARFERDNFATEYVVNQNIQAEISRLIGADFADGRQYLYARDSSGRDLTLRSDAYIPYIGKDKARLSTFIASLSYRTAAVSVAFDPGEGKNTYSVGIESLAYVDVISDAGILQGDVSTITVGVDSLEYV